ncbi:Leucine rich adaptor protein 1 [Oryzias melastigma]|uniref:Leucine rich adaptor protein 1 n=1 Tax=Oryzias melastigma TaxID=30732 RepID=A0A834KWU5_ORYME|nr:Leucine rich adaptor protein 1 [Oryzias melastigma]
MDESSESIPDLKDIEVKIGRKTPEGLLRWMREEGSSLRGDKLAQDPVKETGRKSLDEKIRRLKVEMAHLRSVDVKILQQLLAVHEGIEAVKWLMEERSTLTSHCSSLTSSQYSLGDGPDTSWRGSWSSLQDPTIDKLDNISIGSYLDTLADEMDEYCPSSSESVICSTPLASENAAGSFVTGGSGAKVNGVEAGNGTASAFQKNGRGRGDRNEEGGRVGPENGNCGVTSSSSPQAKSEKPKQDSPASKSAEKDKTTRLVKDNKLTQSIKTNGILEKTPTKTCSPTHASFSDKLGTNQSPKLKPYKNGNIDLDSCKMNGKVHLEYDAHWRWVQSQEDVTFL